MYLMGSANRVTKLSLRPPIPHQSGHGVLPIFLASELELSHKDAKHWLHREDRDCVAMSRSHFGSDPLNATPYDLVINTDHMTLQVAARSVALALAAQIAIALAASVDTEGLASHGTHLDEALAESSIREVHALGGVDIAERRGHLEGVSQTTRSREWRPEDTGCEFRSVERWENRVS